MCRTVVVMFRRLLTIVGATFVVVGCSAGSTESLPDQQAAWNEADVEFVTGMIPHHEQALEMADLIAGKSVSSDVVMLADEIRAAQGPEIAVMQGYLAQWGTKADPHAGHGGGDAESGHGMMTQEDLSALAAATGPAFEQMWLSMMIAHHEGAVTMAREVLAAGKEPQVQALAEAVIAGQTAEIAQMRALLTTSG
jgi:uncharacterized protein (DUF305 family)